MRVGINDKKMAASQRKMAIISTFKNIYSGVCVCWFKDKKNHRLIALKCYSYGR